MSTALYTSPIFGPIHSRRLGLSLGVNLLPRDGKLCNFDCVYCECGFNACRRPTKSMPTRDEVLLALRKTLKNMKATNQELQTITFAGNGEPTLHPEFSAIVSETMALRDAIMPQAKISVLTNATRILKDSVLEALLKVDNALLKLDTVNEKFIRLVDRPTSRYSLASLIPRMKLFGGSCMIQTIFLKGFVGSQFIDNTGDTYVLPWLEAIKEIHPKLVTIYTIDRDTPVQSLQKATHRELDRIAQLVENEKIPVSVSY